MSVEEKCETLEGSQIRLSSSVRQRDASSQLAMNFDPRPTTRCLAHPSSVRRFRSVYLRRYPPICLESLWLPSHLNQQPFKVNVVHYLARITYNNSAGALPTYGVLIDMFEEFGTSSVCRNLKAVSIHFD